MTDNINNDNDFNYTIQENNKTVKSILSEKLNFSKRLSKKLEMSDKISINNRVARLNKIVFEGDVLTVCYNDESDEYEAVDMPIDILYEDNDFLIVNKPPFVVVHPTKSHLNNTIANGVAYYFKKQGIQKKVRLVNRLDMNTSGIVIIAKNPFAHNEMCNQMKTDKVDKYYYAIVEGVIEEDKGTINAPIARREPEDILRVVDPSGKECITHYEVEKRYDDKTFVKLKLETGRTHQIRVHMKHIGHPVLADSLYGHESQLIDRQALHCYEMSFEHPMTHERINIKCPLPQDMAKILNV